MNVQSDAEFNCRLRVILAEKGQKHGWFAERIGISKGTLSALVNNKQLPVFSVAYAICEELEMPLQEIWVRVEDDTKHT